jgi:hypothetical protein
VGCRFAKNASTALDSGVNIFKTCRHGAFAEFTKIYQIEADFKARVENEFNEMIAEATGA